MPLPFDGTVVSINRRPASNVEVRVYDLDNPEQNSDELTDTASISGPDGHFSGWFEPLRAIDFVNQAIEVVWYEPADPRHGNFRPVRHTRVVNVQAPDLSDAYDPALEFRYQASGRPALVRRRGFPSLSTLPHVVNPEPVTWPMSIGVADDWAERPAVFLRGADQRIWAVLELNTGHVCAAQPLPDPSDSIRPFRVARTKDKCLAVFGRDGAGRLQYCRQQVPGGVWSAWASLGGQLSAEGALSAVVNSDGRLEVFARGTDGAIWHIWQQGDLQSWSAWQSLGGAIHARGSIAAVSDSSGRLNLFYHGTDHQIWMIRQTSAAQGPWSNHVSLGGVTVFGPLAAGKNQDGRLEVFVQGRDGDILHSWQLSSGGWSRWESLGGVWVAGSLSASNHADGRLIISVQGTNRNLYARSQRAPNSGWDSWTDLGQPTGQGWIPPVPPADPVTIHRRHGGALVVLWRGADGSLYACEQNGPNGGWGNWRDLGAVPPPPPLVAPLLQSAVAGNQSVRLHWNNVAGAERYRVEWSGDLTGSAETASTVFTVTGLHNDVEYKFCVTAENGCHRSASSCLNATPAAKPDLATGFIFASATAPMANKDFTVSSSVANAGSLATNVPFKCRMVCERHPDGGSVDWETYDFTAVSPPFEPGAVLELTWTHSRPKGNYWYWLEVDYENTVSNELDEGNNRSGLLGVLVVD